MISALKVNSALPINWPSRFHVTWKCHAKGVWVRILMKLVDGFWKFMLTLVPFNLTTANVVLWLSIAFDSVTGKFGWDSRYVQVRLSLLDLRCLANEQHSLLFTGLLINWETVAPALQWLHTISFFHATFEALDVNELRYLQLKEIKVWLLSCPMPLYSPLYCSTALN